MKPVQNLSEEELTRLDDIVKNLALGRKWTGSEMNTAIVDACVRKVTPLISDLNPQGEQLADTIASHYHVKFEEVRSEGDIDHLEEVYLKGKREPVFALVRDEIHCPNVDAFLIQRQRAQEADSDRWVAILNLTITESRAYWNKFHELAHRIAEPPQLRLKFRRQLVNHKDIVEVLMDEIAGEIGFHRNLFLPLVHSISKQPLTFNEIEQLKTAYCPTASLLALTNAVVSKWSHPALAFVAEIRGKGGNAHDSPALRVVLQGRNEHARKTGFLVFKNMRVPETSVVYDVFRSGIAQVAFERTGTWITSDGSRLRDERVLISAIPIGGQVYVMMSA